MQKWVITLLVLLVPTFSNVFADIKDSHHDFSGREWSNGEICLPCHTPHNANMDVPNAPLWNHQTTQATFQIYQTSTIDAAIGQPNGLSKLCLSCHDGTVAIENHSGNTDGTTYASFGNLTTNLSDDHPISFIYNSALAQIDGGLNDPSTTLSGLGGTIEQDLLYEGRLECSSCHDPHISRNTEGCNGCHNVHGGDGQMTKTLSLRISNDGSQLCLTCHKK